LAQRREPGPDKGDRGTTPDRGNRIRSASSLALGSTVGFTMVICTAIGFFFGRWLDSKLGTDPAFLAIFTLLGAAAGFYELYRVSVRMSEDDKR
jgi:ATP synthase protein I